MILRGEKYGKEEEAEKKPPRHITPVPVKGEKKIKGLPAKKAKTEKKTKKSSEKKPKKLSKKKTPVTAAKPSTT